jgi:hypothetical protein
VWARERQTGKLVLASSVLTASALLLLLPMGSPGDNLQRGQNSRTDSSRRGEKGS